MNQYLIKIPSSLQSTFLSRFSEAETRLQQKTHTILLISSNETAQRVREAWEHLSGGDGFCCRIHTPTVKP